MNQLDNIFGGIPPNKEQANLAASIQPTELDNSIDFKLDLDNGKYTYLRYKHGGQEALRHGEKWRNLTGDNLIYFMGCLIEEQAKRSRELEQQLAIRNNECETICKKLVTAENANIQLKMDIQHIHIQHEEEFKEVMKESCEHCGSTLIYYGPPNCPSCGAPNCCQTCCKLTSLEQQLALLHIEYKKALEAISDLIKVDGSRLHPVDMTQKWLRVEQLLSTPSAIAAMKGGTQ